MIFKEAPENHKKLESLKLTNEEIILVTPDDTLYLDLNKIRELKIKTESYAVNSFFNKIFITLAVLVNLSLIIHLIVSFLSGSEISINNFFDTVFFKIIFIVGIIIGIVLHFSSSSKVHILEFNLLNAQKVLLYMEDKVMEDKYMEDLRELLRLSQQNDPVSMNRIGLLFTFDDGIPQDFSQAKNWFEKAAKEGSGDGMQNLADAYYFGKGTTKSYEKAKYWYEQAMVNGHASAAINIGLMYFMGRGVSKDFENAKKWYKKAIELGAHEEDGYIKEFENDADIKDFYEKIMKYAK